ncbi:protein-disulfide reductase DsbD family protein [Pseudemcibacter aquimaris]|uniref:protein-disulfide reductase DsbD family protein n=1 Tax=Pseudemcibacter aquimaris TaxID=2857064 RepID=UPI002011E788|nr:protein-disulfide reductase DsbD domain-containing protein [Pseudemcibacter aquimaris]MCC3860347.1 thioredoxin family protein [Pseudemcibacter aquimaris]WDU57673.1 thioredoxin family protein [Pseudemcibacter aquimaris]
MIRSFLRILFFGLVALTAMLGVSNATSVRTDLANLELTADKTSISPGSEFTVIIEMTPDEGWHGYWENPGDAGLKLEMDWKLPDGVEIGDFQFTTPHLIPFEEIVSYGYEGTVTIIADGKLSEDFNQDQLILSGNAFWLICSDALCVPQDAPISHTIDIGDDVTDNARVATVETVKADMPVHIDWPSSFHTDGENFTVKSILPDEIAVIESAYLFPFSDGMMENVYRQNLSFINGEIIGRFNNAFRYEDNDTFEFVLTFKTGEGVDHAYFLSASKSMAPIAPVFEMESSEAAPTLPSLDFGTALLFAFLGGVILNLMPCVFPILSLKAMSVVELSKKDPTEVRISGLLYTGGVVLSFGLLGVIVSLFSLGWGFHMQMPLVNFSLGLLMVLIGLNLLGVFEIGSSLMGVGQNLVASNNSRKSTFFTGVLAVVVATPCTAPFMAGALGYAFLSGGVTGIIIFLALGFGLAFPYLLLCFVPAFRRALPRPGAWMENLRKILGIPMFATALWLFWILGNQLGVNAMTIAIAAGLLLSLSIWALNKNETLWKAVSIISAIGVLFTGYYLSNLDTQKSVIEADESGLQAIAFSSNELNAMLDRGEPVFVYFTADWCVTCKLNERVALSQDNVHQAFAEKDITVMVGDWTNQNPDITRTLQRYGRIGVPLYLYFPVGRTMDNPDILPQILTPDIVIDAL